MKNKILPLALAGSLMLNAVPILNVSAVTYTDVSTSHWAYKYIVEVTDNGWFSGDTAGTFRPDDYMKRSEVATVLAKVLGLTTTETNIFTDISSHWAAKSINATSHLFLDTDSLTTTAKFSPDDYITREEAILAFVIGYEHVSGISTTSTSNLNIYSDLNQLSTAMYPYASTAVDLGFISGNLNSDGTYTLAPQNALKRAEFATLIIKADKVGYGDISSYKNYTPYSLSNSSYTTTSPTYTISGSMKTDALPATEIYVNGIEVPVDSYGNFSYTMSLTTTSTPVTVKTVDIFGNTSTSSFTVTYDTPFSSYQLEILALVNDIRAQYGLNQLELSESLCASAQTKTNQMIADDYFSHYDKSGYCYALDIGVGENIHAGTKSTTAQYAFDAWMASTDGHRDRILDPSYKYLGVGYGYDRSTYYYYYWTQHFK